jgi:hypothetical protein
MFVDLILPTAAARNIVSQIGASAFRIASSYVVNLHMKVMSFFGPHFGPITGRPYEKLKLKS